MRSLCCVGSAGRASSVVAPPLPAKHTTLEQHGYGLHDMNNIAACELRNDLTDSTTTSPPLKPPSPRRRSPVPVPRTHWSRHPVLASQSPDRSHRSLVGYRSSLARLWAVLRSVPARRRLVRGVHVSLRRCISLRNGDKRQRKGTQPRNLVPPSSSLRQGTAARRSD